MNDYPFSVEQLRTSLPVIQSLQDKETLIAAVLNGKAEIIVGVTGGKYKKGDGNLEVRDFTIRMSMSYDSGTKNITLSDIVRNVQIPLKDVEVKNENGQILISLPEDYVMPFKSSIPEPSIHEPTKSVAKSVVKHKAQPTTLQKLGIKKGGTKYKKSMKNKRKTKKHKSRRYRKIK